MEGDHNLGILDKTIEEHYSNVKPKVQVSPEFNLLSLTVMVS